MFILYLSDFSKALGIICNNIYNAIGKYTYTMTNRIAGSEEMPMRKVCLDHKRG